MMKSKDPFLIAALDIGTSKINAFIAECKSDHIDILAVGTSPSEGMKRGIITNIEATTQSIQKAVSLAESSANRKIKQVYTGIAGSHIRSLNSYGKVSLENHEVMQSDIDRVMQATHSISLPKDQQFLHVLSQEFIVDNQPGIQEPLGMAGLELSAKVHIVTGATNAFQNITKCIKSCGIDVKDIILEPLASSQAVLTEDEKEFGVCLLDIGGGTADMALFTGGAIRHTAVLPIAGDHVTRDIVMSLHLPADIAEGIKRRYAHALPEKVSSDDWLELQKTEHRPARNIPLKALAEVVGARYEELFYLARKELESRGYWKRFPMGLILTGGASHVKGVLELAKRIFETPVRQGFPNYTGHLADTLQHGGYATGVGLIYHAYQHYLQDMPGNTLHSMYQRMRLWLQRKF